MGAARTAAMVWFLCAAVRPSEASMPAPVSRPSQGIITVSESIIANSELTGSTGLILFRLSDKKVLDMVMPKNSFPPASTIKIATAAHALTALGTRFRFETRLIVTGGIGEDGDLDGDLYLQGGGDPTLDTKDLADMVNRLRERGVRRVRGRFLFDDYALPRGSRIDPRQRDHISANVGFGGLNLNFNRVRMESSRTGPDTYDVRLLAVADGKTVEVDSIEVEVFPDEDDPTLEHLSGGAVERWRAESVVMMEHPTRWLPVGNPGAYAASAFHRLALQSGIRMSSPTRSRAPAGAEILVRHSSRPLARIVAEMLLYSNNVTAEILGLAAASGAGKMPENLKDAASVTVRSLFGDPPEEGIRLDNHSGLSIDSRMTPYALRDLLLQLAAEDAFHEDIRLVLPIFNLGNDEETGEPFPPALVHAKSGTLHFVHGLVGYMHAASCGQNFGFAILSEDLVQRQEMEIFLDSPLWALQPRAPRDWRERAQRLEKKLIGSWLRRFECI